MRFLILRVAVYLGLLVLGLGLFRTQVIEGGRYRKLSEQNRIRLIPLEAPRGRVLDRNGKVLATNRASYNVIAVPEDVTPEVFLRLAKLLGLSEKEIRKRMSAPREVPFAPALIQEDVPRELAFTVEERRPELPGVNIQIEGIRFYPYDETASHIIGYIGKINQEEYQILDHARFGMNSFIGRAGIEKLYDDRLRGWRGGRQIEVNARGELIRVLGEKPPEAGQDIKLTLDLDFQQKVMELIQGKHAAVSVVNLRSDDLLVLASAPAFNPNVFVSPGRGSERLEFLRDPDSPLIDRGVSSAYPPGSVFKLVTALAALETGKVNPNTRFYCPGSFRLKPGSRPFKCWNARGHGSLNLYEALERSCNVYFWNIASKISPDDIARFAHQLGLGERIQLETTNVATGLVPDSAWKKQRFREQWYQGETLNFAVGQGYLLTSPIQVLRLVGIIANNGYRIEPRLLFDKEALPRQRVLALHEENLKVVKRGMLQVVNSDYGTGQLARVDFTKLAAKTGTAQVPPKQAHSWMTGFFPYENPEIAFVVFVEHGGSGGVTSAKIVKSMVEIWRQMNVAAPA